MEINICSFKYVVRVGIDLILEFCVYKISLLESFYFEVIIFLISIILKFFFYEVV